MWTAKGRENAEHICCWDGCVMDDSDCRLVAECSNEDARLIAAAPELLEALQPFARYLEVLQEMGGNTPKTGPYMAVSSSIAGDAEITVEDMIAARAAIRKATEAAS